MAVRHLLHALTALLVIPYVLPCDDHSHAQKRDFIIPSTLPGSWTSQGCNLDVGRTLTGDGYNDDLGMTIESCILYCGNRGYIYAGTEYSAQCFCGNSLAAGSGPTPASDCNMACSGNATEPCGGPNRLNLFWSGQSGPVTNRGSGLWNFIGCYEEGQTGRTLTNGVATTGGPTNMTVDHCTSACQAAEYTLAGVEYAEQCWCGNAFVNGGIIAPDGLAGCNMLCQGNFSEYCGGSARLDVYNFNSTFISPTGASSTATASPTRSVSSTPTGPSVKLSVGPYNYNGCQTEGTNARALAAKTSAYDSMTLESCEADCTGYTYFGTEYSRECYCGNVFSAGSVPAPNSDCNALCSGDIYEYCGAGNRLSVYQLNGTITRSTTSSTTPTATSSFSPMATTPPGWFYVGCWVDGANGRILAYQQPDSQTNTVESCINTCAGLGYSIAGMEYSVQCFCDNTINNAGSLATAQSDCSMPCSGNSGEICGAGNRLSIYSIRTPQVLQVPVAQTTDLPGDWVYQGCLQDNFNDVRTFPYEIIYAQNNSAVNCLTQCQEYGYNAAGLEYGLQCFCGDVSNIATVGATTVPESECSVLCSGNSSYLCGAGDLLTYYAWTGIPLYEWNFLTGTDAGEYSLLIGGVCIPLMTSQAITGKVTFVEKSGTGEMNSTGAYELDLSEINNFTQAWRTMHVKTDVFCSAGLTLPDIAGRQINMGGWSNPSTYGVRLYWPDGSPGVWGTNDWEENVDEVRLQVPRWYPSATIMANGSILVVGGETGSNALASPTLEIIPPTGFGMVYLDFLERTNPNNLYPFIAVLPSGIFVAYYNEALILDESNFKIKKQLPNIPGAVNNFDGGRNYPLEGTMALLPQYAPYTDLLTVLICGGSTPGPADAIDNCVSTQPEAAEPVWVIERMPSRRVMACIAALPDGTYLILNGGQHGTAGFGLGSLPNLNAILYDPSKPVNRRISVMANTTVARLYHSEAILLADGRVLVSGSDPQDGLHPEEYRVEVFTPPYLLSGLPQPTFTIQNKDWSYDASLTFTLTSGSTANLRVSLLGSVSSTHGNSMGQRTIFPQVSCAENTCTVVAPPNAHVCPPGWFQMFVLDGKTPSIAKFVRIGGDPAEIGNWPDYPDFNVPGL